MAPPPPPPPPRVEVRHLDAHTSDCVPPLHPRLCPPSAQVDFMYDSGYVYHKSRDVLPAGTGSGVDREDMIRDVELSAQGWEVQSKQKVPRTFEGWWELSAPPGPGRASGQAGPAAPVVAA